MIWIFLVYGTLLLIGFILNALARRISAKGPLLRNTMSFCLAGGAAWSVTTLLGFWMDGWKLYVPAGNLMWPTITWLVVAFICAQTAILSKGSPYALGLPFFLFALVIAISPLLPTFPADGSVACFLAIAFVLGLTGAIPISRWARGIAVACLQIYLFTVICAVPYFNWKVAKEDGFVQWLLLGECTATSKATIWPYFAFQRSAPHAKQSENVVTVANSQ